MSENIVEVLEEITLERVEIVLIEIEKHGGHRGHRHHQLVTVSVDAEPKQVHPGRYSVSVFKRAVGVDASYELDQVESGKLVPLADDSQIRICGGEVFVSHVRSGSSS